MKSNDLVEFMQNKKVDFVYIDGDHRYGAFHLDIKTALKLTNYNGFIGGHDYYNNWPGVVRAMNEIINKKDLITFPDSSWVVSKRKITKL